MKFIKLLRYDLRNGSGAAARSMLAVLLVVLFSCVELTMQKEIFYRNEASVPASTFLDYACYLLGGIKVFSPDLGEDFVFPVKWMLLHMLLMYGTLNYPCRDLESLGSTILPKSGRRVPWWISKCVWNLVTILTAYGLVFLTLAGCCFLFGGIFVPEITPQLVNELMYSLGENESIPQSFAFTVLGLPVLVTLSGSMLQMTLTLFVKPMFSFGILAAYLLVSAYLPTSFLPAGYGMAIRSRYVIEDGFEPALGVLLCVLLLVGAVVMGQIRFRRYDILNKE